MNQSACTKGILPLKPLVITTLLCSQFFNQSALHAQQANKTMVSGYVDPYYSYADKKPVLDANTYNFSSTNQLALNLAYIKLAHTHTMYRANVAMMTGTYAQRNLASEPVELRNILEANIGTRLSKKHQLWLDAGVMPSHIGYESTAGADNMLLSRSYVADNSPYFETGAKLSYTSADEKLYVATLVLNGWQNIAASAQFQSLGLQASYTPTSKLKFNYSNFLQELDLDAGIVYHDLWCEYKPTEKLTVMALADFGRGPFGNFAIAKWSTLQVAGKYSWLGKHANMYRAELITDKNGQMYYDQTNGANTFFAQSVGYDLAINANQLLRFEVKNLLSNGTINKSQMLYYCSMTRKF
jgi:hypothetical protein